MKRLITLCEKGKVVLPRPLTDNHRRLKIKKTSIGNNITVHRTERRP